VFFVRRPAGHVVLPHLTVATELVVAVVEGGCTIGEDAYPAAKIRVQEAGTPMDAVVAGGDGAAAVILVADRRALDAFEPGTADGDGWGLGLLYNEYRALSAI
jgi:hypothetical protein